MWDQRYRQLKEGELILPTDQCDMCRDGWRDPADWRITRCREGERAPNPMFPSHRKYRRKIAAIKEQK